MRVGLKDLASAWYLPGRALFLGLPLTLVGTAILARWIVGLPWAESFLIGAVLSPTDPVFAAAIVGREEVPARLRQLLNVESGLNDGLALTDRRGHARRRRSGAIQPHGCARRGRTRGRSSGSSFPWVAIRLEQSRFFSAHTTYQPLNAFAIGLLVLTISSMAHANEFLAAFAAGITVATVGPEVREAFHRFGELVAELLKLAALLVFGALISPRFLGEIPRQATCSRCSSSSRCDPWRCRSRSCAARWAGERAAAAWFGPKGFASVVFGLLILKEAKDARIDWARADHLFHLVALCIAGSILAHSSTDVLMARWLGRDRREAEPPHDPSSGTHASAGDDGPG